MRRAGFTLIELLVTIGIIAVLAGLLIVGISAATRRGQMTNTRFLMSSMAQALARFNADHGYYPPVLGDPKQLVATGGSAVLGWSSSASASTQGQLGWMRDVLLPPTKARSNSGSQRKTDQWNSAESKALQKWNSVTTPAEYLIGYGDRSCDGYGICGTLPDIPPAAPKQGQREVPREGIRSPGMDGAWGACLTPTAVSDVTGAGVSSNYTGGKFGTGLFVSRNLALPSRVAITASANEKGNDDSANILRCQPNLQGKVYGPYLELKDASAIGGIKGLKADGEPDIVRATDGDPNFDQYPKCILDYWGQPIRYYRRGYMNMTPSSADPSTDGTRFDLGDFFALRPTRADEADFVDKAEAAREALDDENPDMATDGTMNGKDRSSTRRLRAAEFALLSYGPDKKADLTRRIGFSGPRKEINVNEDNIVETGP